VSGNPQHFFSFGRDSGGAQQHFLSVDALFGRKCEMFRSQPHPSHKHNPSGAAVLNTMANMTKQATRCRTEIETINDHFIVFRGHCQQHFKRKSQNSE
jgi:hypothetical protein